MTRRRALGIAAAAATAVAAVPAAAQAVPLAFDRTVERSGSGFLIDMRTNELSPRTESPAGMSIMLPRGTTLDMLARKRTCSAQRAAAVSCPRTSRIGFGHVVARFTGYLFPGGEVQAVAAMTAYLAPPRVDGDPGSVVLQVRPLGVNAIREVVFGSFGLFLPELRFVWGGRIVRHTSGPYGYEFRLDGLPAGLRLPLPLTGQLIRFKLAIGAVRRLPKTFYRHFRVPVFKGDTITYKTRRVKDHYLVPHHLMRNPRRCLTGGWPWELRVRFPDGEQVTKGRQPCKVGKIPISPPRSPSAPQHS
jgi:hypothetical protein